jgi:hypothetical protein
MKLKKESKIRVLENFYSLDYVLFGKPVSKVDTCCPVFVEEYLSVKGALMSLVIEMYKLVKHSPEPLTEKVETKNLHKMAKQSAIIARENCKKLVTSQKGREDVKQDLRESLSKTKKKVDIERLVQEKIRTKAYSLAVDNLLVGRAITESKKYSKLNTWNGRIIEDAYKILRDNLVEAAMNIIENSADTEEVKKKVISEFTLIELGLLIGAGAAAAIFAYKRKSDQEYKLCMARTNNKAKCKAEFQVRKNKMNEMIEKAKAKRKG